MAYARRVSRSGSILHGRPDHFVIGKAVGDGLVMGSIDADGGIGIGPLVPINTSA
jgi:hypothetical protein